MWFNFKFSRFLPVNLTFSYSQLLRFTIAVPPFESWTPQACVCGKPHGRVPSTCVLGQLSLSCFFRAFVGKIVYKPRIYRGFCPLPTSRVDREWVPQVSPGSWRPSGAGPTLAFAPTEGSDLPASRVPVPRDSADHRSPGRQCHSCGPVHVRQMALGDPGECVSTTGHWHNCPPNPGP